MKAKEYAEQFLKTKDAEGFDKAIGEMFKGMFLETGEIMKQRKSESNDAFFAVFEEIQKRWEAACRIINPQLKDAVISSEGFILLSEKKLGVKLRRLPE